jgi:hypothetical protein
MAIGQVTNPATGTATIPGVASGAAGSNSNPTNSTATPTTAVPTVTNPTATTQANPYAAPAATASTSGISTVPATSSTGSTTSNSPSTIQSNGINYGSSQGTDASNSVAGDFEATYGQGTGTAITDLLQNMGTVDSSAIQATIANTDLAAGKQYANIQSGEAASGVTANSSTASLAAGDFYSGVNSQLQQTIGSEEESEQSQLLQSLTQEGEAHGGDESGLDSLMNGITDAGEIGGALSGL